MQVKTVQANSPWVTEEQVLTSRARLKGNSDAMIKIRFLTNHSFRLDFLSALNQHVQVRQTLIRDGADPALKVMPAWKIGDGAVVMLSYHRGAEDEVLDVLAASSKGIRQTQQFEADGIDLLDYSAEDGNGDVRLFDGLPMAFRCLFWSIAHERLEQHACKSLPEGSTAPR